MWKTLHQLAIPPRLYQICGWFIPWLAIASVVVLTVGWIWGFGFAPADYQQGNSYRIIYLHVPAAIWSMGIYASMAVAAFIGLVWQMKMANLAVAAMAPIGAVFTFIALVTGSAWGKPMWGTWWVWDARLTSELVLPAGQQRRVALARLWLTRATLWILDEPFTAIDVNGVDRLTQRMAQHTEQGGIVILTTHQPLNVAESKIRRISLTQTRAA